MCVWGATETRGQPHILELRLPVTLNHPTRVLRCELWSSERALSVLGHGSRSLSKFLSLSVPPFPPLCKGDDYEQRTHGKYFLASFRAGSE